MGFREALAENCECTEKTTNCCIFQQLKKECIEVLNRMAKDNTSLRTQLEKSNIQLKNNPNAKKDRQNGNNQLSNLALPFSPHPSQGKVPIRKIGSTGKAWESHRDDLRDIFSIYADTASMVLTEMMNQGFTDHDIVDALFPCSNGDRRLSTHNAGPCHHTPL
jgi:hypothetical protein